MASKQTAEALIQDRLRDPETSWSIGTFGAIGEFHRDADEPTEISLSPGGGSVLTGRGGIRVQVSDQVRVAPYESLRRGRDLWQHGVNVCQDEDIAGRSKNTALTEIGPDHDALRPEDCDAILFDMGLAAPHVDVCIRTDDAELITLLRENIGSRLLVYGNPAMDAIKRRSPNRVFISNIGRVEVYQHIGSTQRGIETPMGPHTHVISKLLSAGRTHAANVHVPDDHVPCLSFYPPNPVLDEMGAPKVFSADAHEAFQDLVDQYGEDWQRDLKAHVFDEVANGFAPPNTDEFDRPTRVCIRVTLRQLMGAGIKSETLTQWRDAFEPVNETVSESDGESDAEILEPYKH